jgi:DNA-binding transcriptional MerR regulator
VKTLRHYHEAGLLEPADVDEHTGYRYYSLDQVPTAQVIRRLRGLDMPVADVKAVLAAQDVRARNHLISAHLAPLENRLQQTHAAVESLRDLLQRPVATHRGPLGNIDLTYAALGTYAARHEIGIDGPLREYYLRDPLQTSDEQHLVTEVGWPIFRSDH